MGDIYTLTLQNPQNALTISQNISVANKSVLFQAAWPSAVEEQYGIIQHYFDTRAQSDPLVVDGDYVRNYDYFLYYAPLFSYTEAQLTTWITQQDVLPNSILTASNTAEKLLRLQNNITDCRNLAPLVQQYQEMMIWKFQVMIDGQLTVGVIRPGGWYRTTDDELQLRFISGIEHIGKEDLGLVTIEFEVSA